MHCIHLYVKHEAGVAPTVGSLCEQQGFGVDHELCQRLVAVDYRAWCPLVVNKRMSRIKRQCSPVCCKLGSAPHIRNQQKAQEPQADMMNRNIDSPAWSLLRLYTDAPPKLLASQGNDDDMVVNKPQLTDWRNEPIWKHWLILLLTVPTTFMRSYSEPRMYRYVLNLCAWWHAVQYSFSQPCPFWIARRYHW